MSRGNEGWQWYGEAPLPEVTLDVEEVKTDLASGSLELKIAAWKWLNLSEVRLKVKIQDLEEQLLAGLDVPETRRHVIALLTKNMTAKNQEIPPEVLTKLCHMAQADTPEVLLLLPIVVRHHSVSLSAQRLTTIWLEKDEYRTHVLQLLSQQNRKALAPFWDIIDRIAFSHNLPGMAQEIATKMIRTKN